jgi:hypothetical protein
MPGRTLPKGDENMAKWKKDYLVYKMDWYLEFFTELDRGDYADWSPKWLADRAINWVRAIKKEILPNAGATMLGYVWENIAKFQEYALNEQAKIIAAE